MSSGSHPPPGASVSSRTDLERVSRPSPPQPLCRYHLVFLILGCFFQAPVSGTDLFQLLQVIEKTGEEGQRGCEVLTVSFEFTEMKLVLKGCSNVSNSTCEFLAPGNRMVGGITFLKFECGDSSDASSTPTPTPLSTTNDTGSKGFCTPLTLASLLLLRLLL